MSHENQKIALGGTLKESKTKDLRLSFQDVHLDNLLPALEKFTIKGNLNGVVNLKQENAIYQPTAAVKIDSLHLNSVCFGNAQPRHQGR